MLLKKVIQQKVFPAKKDAIIDLGSNSIRMLIYQDFTNSQIPVFNEKAVCALGKTLDKTGRLDPEGVEYAYNVLERFKNILDNSKISSCEVIATAAVREAKDSKEFIEKVEQILNQKVNVLTGEEEAERSALGVISGFEKADGIVADLGGGSLELARIKSGKILNKATLPLGVLRLMNQPKKRQKKVGKLIMTEISNVSWLSKTKVHNLYLVGGTWRAWLKARIFSSKYPLNILHQYTISPEEASQDCVRFSTKKKIISLKLDLITKSRTDYIPVSLDILSALLVLVSPEKVVCSISGLREGTLIKNLPETFAAEDTLDAFISYSAFKNGDYGENYIKYLDFIKNIFSDNENFPLRLLPAACSLSGMDWGMGAFQKAELVFSQILNTPTLKLSHYDRMKLACAGFWRHCGVKYYPDLNILKLLNNNEIKACKQVGSALRLASGIANMSSIFLDNINLFKKGKTLVLEVPNKLSQIISKQVIKRFKTLAKELSLEYKIIYSS
jgi:exopolyphosphatase / guanosine-5'-triphosphate,3'-diphosphate pyrophosphatase